MNVHFRASFARDLNKISNKNSLKHVRETIEQIERAASLQEIHGLTKLKGGRNYYRIRVGEYRIGMILEADTLYSCAAWIARRFTAIFHNQLTVVVSGARSLHFHDV